MTAWQKIQKIAPAAIGACLFVLSIGAINSELHHYGWQNVLASFQGIVKTRLAGAFALMLINYIILTGYDTLAMFYLGQSLPLTKTSFVGFVSYAISNSVGLALLSGSAIRYRLYQSWQVSAPIIAQAIAFCNLSFWVGLLTVGGITFVVDPLQLPAFLHLPFLSVHPIGFTFLAIIGIYLLITGNLIKPFKIGQWQTPKIPFAVSLAQIGLTAVDWILASGILYVLLPGHHHLSFPGFFGIYLLAQVAGIISNVPGGLGVFETVVLFLLTPKYSSVQVLGALLAYRVIYYWIPLGSASLSLGAFELLQHRRERRQKSGPESE
jgi:uncharacterized membrane protein YbhN (UPF0104 family)